MKISDDILIKCADLIDDYPYLANYDEGKKLAEMIIQEYLRNQWMPISTAPKDGRQILLWCIHDNFKYTHGKDKENWQGPVVGYWSKETEYNPAGWVWHGLCGQHTHWMPLPRSPEDGK